MLECELVSLLGHIVATMTLNCIEQSGATMNMDTIVAFVMPLVALLISSPMV
jgi:hypothetical protein